MSYGHTTDVSHFDEKGNVTAAGRGGGNIATFYLEDRIGEDGHIIQREMVLIRAPGDNKSEWGGKVTDEIRREYSREYEAFKRGVTLQDEGTPIQTWTELGVTSRRELMLLGFNTIEQLAEASDAQCSGITNGMVLRRKAQIHVQKNRKPDTTADDVKALKEQNQQLIERLAALEAKSVLPQSKQGDDAPKRRGRRPRAAGDKSGPGSATVGLGGVSQETGQDVQSA